jgi:Fe2+ or Zn2+ uptake regulation protein
VDSGYTSIEHRLNFFGVCPKCQVTRKTRRLS